ncbi:glycoside hydrolase family 88 protein [Paenibacillus sp. J5C_2022]|uniref:glycoside hydrolase family 88 protein n=1 Tax=Paenibacillus sp. J5C2022 TaxID=2977129 RepID=UPI0021CDF6F1|nr:glycoside hydrolase family 88 protein [Paenibacillus sp. J5C2022]MCU6712717.1 glycoside hydrolase family 88 protein [Paenibacillus sp. J5C2022]
MWKQAIEDAVAKTQRNVSAHGLTYPHIDNDQKYDWGENNDWIEGFYTGMLWLCYRYTGDEAFKKAAMEQGSDFRKRLDNDIALEHHDIGFLYMPSAFAQWRLAGDESAKRLALDAADKLLGRWRPKGNYIQAWGPAGDEKNGGRIIIDCLMNLPLLYWASETTGEAKYKDIAFIHAEQSLRYLVRGDDSSYHTFYFDQESGIPLGGGTHQGYHDGSTWTRGQAWGVYGFALSYRYTRDPRFLEASRRLARYFIAHLPEDHVAYWDFDAPIEAGTPRDSSASAITACGLLELIGHLEEGDGERAYFQEHARRMMESLVKRYATIGEEAAEGLIRHGSYSVRTGNAPDSCMIWGDYYYLEALLRLERGFAGFWYEIK